MKRNTINFWIDLLTFIVLYAMVWTGMLIHYVLPPGQGRCNFTKLWGLNRHEYGAIHFYAATAMLALVIIHIWLHWSWICNSLADLLKTNKHKPSRHLFYGVTSLVLLFLLTIASLLLASAQVVKM